MPDNNIYEECLDVIQSEDVKSALVYMVVFAKKIPMFTCYLHRQGYMLTFRYKNGEVWPYGFIINRKSLLFYFRKAGISSPAAKLEILRNTNVFPEVLRNNLDEIKVRITNKTQAMLLMKMVFGED